MNKVIDIEYAVIDDHCIKVLNINGPLLHEAKAGFRLSNGNLVYRSQRIIHEGGIYSFTIFNAIKDFIIKKLSKPRFTKEREVKIEVKTPVKDKPTQTTSGVKIKITRLSWAARFIVTKIQALTLEELPAIYTESTPDYLLPRVWQDENKLIANGNYILLEEGVAYTYGAIKKALLYIELAGEHLTKANKHLTEKIKPAWAICNKTVFKDGKVLKSTISAT